MTHDNMTWPNYSAQEHLLYSVISFAVCRECGHLGGDGGCLEGHLTGLSWLYCHCTNTQLPIHHRPRNMSGVVIVRSWKTTKDFGNVDINWPPKISVEMDRARLKITVFKTKELSEGKLKIS